MAAILFIRLVLPCYNLVITVNIDETYLDRVHINIISDGIDKLDSETYLKMLEKRNLRRISDQRIL